MEHKRLAMALRHLGQAVRFALLAVGPRGRVVGGGWWCCWRAAALQPQTGVFTVCVVDETPGGNRTEYDQSDNAWNPAVSPC
jgi:hypothetical protein